MYVNNRILAAPGSGGGHKLNVLGNVVDNLRDSARREEIVHLLTLQLNQRDRMVGRACRAMCTRADGRSHKKNQDESHGISPYRLTPELSRAAKRLRLD